jgi:hypothetical protein
MTKPVKITATAENGQIFTRKTARTYTHAVYVEITYSDGRIENIEPGWAGRPDLAEKNLRKNREFAARLQGQEVCSWDQENRVNVGTGVFRRQCRAIAVPVNP